MISDVMDLAYQIARVVSRQNPSDELCVGLVHEAKDVTPPRAVFYVERRSGPRFRVTIDTDTPQQRRG